MRIPSAESQPVEFDRRWFQTPQLSELSPALADGLRDLLQNCDEDLRISRREFRGVLQRCEDPQARLALIVCWGASSSFNRWNKRIIRNFHRWTHAPELMELPAQADEAFKKLWQETDPSRSRFPGIGTSFGTKALYWMPISQGKEPTFFIYDERVFRSLYHFNAKWFQDATQTDFDHPWRCVRFACYRAYCDLLGYAADFFQAQSPADVEVALFLLGRSLPATPEWSGCKGRPEHGGGGPGDALREDDDRNGNADLLTTLTAFNWICSGTADAPH